MYPKLFSGITIKNLELKNRIVLPAMGTKLVTSSKMVTDELINYHVARVNGGTGLSIVEIASVHSPSAPRKYLSLSEDIYIPGLKKLTDAIHEAGGKAGIQLWQGSLAVGSDPAAQILVASDMPVSPEITIPGITTEQIAELTKCYGNAARRAVSAGFDCIEVHMAHNYLPHSFLSGGINHRTDEYGGSFENRAKFPLEIIRSVRSCMPDDMPLFMRIDAHDDYLEGGLTIEEVIAFCRLAKSGGVDVLDISRGNIISNGLKYEVPPIDIPRAFNIENAARIRKETAMITIGVGRINTPDLAEQILAEDKVDMVVIGRAQLADPEFCNKSKNGETEDIDYCVGCNQGCYDNCENTEAGHITCLRNPAVGREATTRISKTDAPETVLIAGGGIGGLEAAVILKQRGHNPILCEKSEFPGGQFLIAGEAPRKEEMKTAIQKMAAKAVRMGIDIRTNTPVTAEMIDRIKPHTFINAIGAIPVYPRIPGAELPFVFDSHDILNGERALTGNVVIIGGGMVGIETAEYLSARGCTVTVLEMTGELVQDMGSTRKISVLEHVGEAGIRTETGVVVTEIKNGAVIGRRNDTEVTFPCDYTVVAIGTKSRDSLELEKACRQNDIAYFIIGDAAKARRAINATREAFDVAMTFDTCEVNKDARTPNKIVVVTGGSGTMGLETIKQLLSRSSRFTVRAIVRPSDKNKKLMKKLSCPTLEVVWGDITDYKTVAAAITGADYVLHIGAMVSPAADKYPRETLYTNIGSTLNIIKAIKVQPNPDKIHFAFVGSVAMTGARTSPIHFGRVGDPINPSIFDYYGLSKVFSEMAVYDSGLKHWVSIRQTGQHPCNESAGEEPIITHQPPNNVNEWSTSIESGICMANICEEWVPESFWRKAYNLSSGSGHRLASWEFLNKQIGAFGYGFKDVYETEMLPLYNFHGHYYTDADDLDDILHLRCIHPEEYWLGVTEETRLLAANPMVKAVLPTAAQMKGNNIAVGRKEGGTYWMFETNQEDWIKAFFGSREKQQQIKSVEEGFKFYHPSETPTYLDHGYNEEIELARLSTADIKKAAEFRGGKCLSDQIPDIYTPIKWQCADGHEFMLSINAVLQGGHWCPDCLKGSWRYGDIAKKNPFYAQVWFPIHGEGDDYAIPMAHSAYDILDELKKKLAL